MMLATSKNQCAPERRVLEGVSYSAGLYSYLRQQSILPHCRHAVPVSPVKQFDNHCLIASQTVGLAIERNAPVIRSRRGYKVVTFRFRDGCVGSYARRWRTLMCRNHHLNLA